MELREDWDPCTHCGTCLSFCAWDATEAAGQPAGPELCKPCQVCYRICPRLPYDRQSLAASLFGAAETSPWGPALGVHTVRVEVAPAGVQDGGFMSTLARWLLTSGRASAVLVTGRTPDWRPMSYWATTSTEIEQAAGSKYSTAPSLSILSEGLKRFERIAVIALPCQSAAVARLAQVNAELREKLVATIGLFCTESFVHGDAHAGLVGLIEQRLGQPVTTVCRMDIKRGRFFARQAGDAAPLEWKIKELNDIVWPICWSCPDLTAEWADISVGAIGSPEGANSVIVRSDRGRALIEAGAAAGLWTLTPLENPESLQKQAERKRGLPAQLSPEQQALYGRATVRGNWKRRRRKAE